MSVKALGKYDKLKQSNYRMNDHYNQKYDDRGISVNKTLT
jgi:hypothetical protein